LAFLILLTVSKAAELLAVKPMTVRAWILRKQIRYVKVGRAVRIPQTAVEELIERGTVEPDSPLGIKQQEQEPSLTCA
jgi:excisionase family DNA binding protein